VTVLSAAGEETSWRADCAERLRVLRRHESPEVRALAGRLFTAPEY
jgi:hypothetical protein